MARIAILGANGMLGHVACGELARSHDVVAIVRRTGNDAMKSSACLPASDLITGVDALDTKRLESVLCDVGPEIVLNCVGLIKQRPEASDTMLAIEINALLPHRLARMCGKIGAKLVHVSTDCVFSGSRGNYAETDIPDAVDIYGRTKLLGEIAVQPHLTVRTSLIGPQLDGQEGLLEWFRAHRGCAIQGYSRAIFSGLTTKALSRVLDQVFRSHASLSGLYHVASEPISKFELLARLAARLDWPSVIASVDTPALDRTLNGQQFFLATGIQMPTWDEMLDELVLHLAQS